MAAFSRKPYAEGRLVEPTRHGEDLRRRKSDVSGRSHPQGGTEGNSFPEFILGWTTKSSQDFIAVQLQ
jgi:hypothetical protein